jgi:aubergine-like protein
MLFQVGRYYYDPVEQIAIGRHKLELWPGYVTSIRQHEDELLLCVELTHKVMRQDTVHDLLQECYRSNPADYQVNRKSLASCHP